jgi:hypothetical protein
MLSIPLTLVLKYRTGGAEHLVLGKYQVLARVEMPQNEPISNLNLKRTLRQYVDLLCHGCGAPHLESIGKFKPNQPKCLHALALAV